MSALMDQRNGSTQTNDLAYLVAKAAEGERGQRLAESKIKVMTGGDRIGCRALYKDYFEFDPQFKLWLATNNLPNIVGTATQIRAIDTLSATRPLYFPFGNTTGWY